MSRMAGLCRPAGGAALVGLLMAAIGLEANPGVMDISPEQAVRVTGGVPADCWIPGTESCGQVSKECETTLCDATDGPPIEEGGPPTTVYVCPNTAVQEKRGNAYNSAGQATSGKLKKKSEAAINCLTTYTCEAAGKGMVIGVPGCVQSKTDGKMRCLAGIDGGSAVPSDPRTPTVPDGGLCPAMP